MNDDKRIDQVVKRLERLEGQIAQVLVELRNGTFFEEAKRKCSHSNNEA